MIKSQKLVNILSKSHSTPGEPEVITHGVAMEAIYVSDGVPWAIYIDSEGEFHWVKLNRIQVISDWDQDGVVYPIRP